MPTKRDGSVVTNTFKRKTPSHVERDRKRHLQWAGRRQTSTHCDNDTDNNNKADVDNSLTSSVMMTRSQSKQVNAKHQLEDEIEQQRCESPSDYHQPSCIENMTSPLSPMIPCSPIMDDIDNIIEHDISSSDVEQLGGVIHTRDELTSPNDDSECEDVNPMSDISTGPCVNSSTSVQTGETLDVISNLVQNLARALHYPDQLDTQHEIIVMTIIIGT